MSLKATIKYDYILKAVSWKCDLLLKPIYEYEFRLKDLLKKTPEDVVSSSEN